MQRDLVLAQSAAGRHMRQRDEVGPGRLAQRRLCPRCLRRGRLGQIWGDQPGRPGVGGIFCSGQFLPCLYQSKRTGLPDRRVGLQPGRPARMGIGKRVCAPRPASPILCIASGCNGPNPNVGYCAGRGYDQATGYGSPNMLQLAWAIIDWNANWGFVAQPQPTITFQGRRLTPGTRTIRRSRSTFTEGGPELPAIPQSGTTTRGTP